LSLAWPADGSVGCCPIETSRCGAGEGFGSPWMKEWWGWVNKDCGMCGGCVIDGDSGWVEAGRVDNWQSQLRPGGGGELQRCPCATLSNCDALSACRIGARVTGEVLNSG
jgi:hypothetical protein